MRHHRPTFSMAKTVAITFFLSFYIFTVDHATAQQKVTLVGDVRSESGAIIGPSVTLRLETLDGDLVDQRIGESDARFQFDNLSDVVYRLRVTAPGFQAYEKEVDLTGPRYNVYIQVVLVPLTKSKAAADLPTLTDEAAPRKARKEYEKGSRALKERNLDDARVHLVKATEEYPCYARAQTDLALAFVLLKDVPSAEAALRKSIACNADYLEAYSRLGILLESSKRFAEGENILEEGLRRSPNSWDLHFQLAAVYSGLERYDKAEEEYLKVRQLNPAPPAELRVRLADLYYRMKNYGKSYAEMQAYLSEEPNGRFAARTRVVMQEMTSSGKVHAADIQPSRPASQDR
ncbi:MAG TPA: tetratricopeptide repeat protein [Terriglobia bacterium]|nr:tetratricopeptide repeat protein [Terriglobia bacterium]